jgi:pimeloyl-ACP methyl ester carboxylesterase
MVDAAPGEGGNSRVAAEAMAAALGSWPVPFVDYDSAAEYFRARFGEGAAVPWASGLEQRDDGLWPRFDVGVMAQTLGEMQEPDTWPQWASVDCPTLVLRAEHGVVDAEAVERMRVTRPEATVVEVAGSRHDLHLDRPLEWRQVLTGFLMAAEGPRRL